MADQPGMQTISGRLERGEIDSAQYLDQLMRYVAAQIGCPRAGLRLFIDTEQGRTLRCVAMFDATHDRMVAAADILHSPDSHYVERLQRDGSFTTSATSATPADPVDSGALGEYLMANQITALMDMSFSVNGALFGTFTCEQLAAPVDWTQRQLQALRKIASRASLTLMHVLSNSFDTAPGALWETSTPNRLATMPMPLDTKPK